MIQIPHKQMQSKESNVSEKDKISQKNLIKN